MFKKLPDANKSSDKLKALYTFPPVPFTDKGPGAERYSGNLKLFNEELSCSAAQTQDPCCAGTQKHCGTNALSIPLPTTHWN